MKFDISGVSLKFTDIFFSQNLSTLTIILHEGLHAFLLSEDNWWGIPAWGIPSREIHWQFQGVKCRGIPAWVLQLGKTSVVHRG
jgi:hypothetical protein